ncbi:GNAT family N-acetyltransferase [Candidatus Bathyarchaeota archaeon]|nr:GNAT family N-acetyltransferase [Candidatus Bathyarchaeota archaeon]
MVVVVKKADAEDVKILSKKLLLLLEDKQSQIYIDNVVKFGIPDEYVKKAFAEETLQKAITKGNSAIYIAFENGKIIGFAQTIKQAADTAELDRIIIFPAYTRKGIGTQLLNHVISDLKENGVSALVVYTGKNETQARRFYEKNGFELIKEATVDTPWGVKLDIVTYKLCL